MVWFNLLLLAFSFIALAILSPKPQIEDARAQELNPDSFPRATENASVPLVLGKVEMKAPNTIWYGDFEARAITDRVRVGLFKKKTITLGFEYFLGLHLALALGPGVRMTQIILDDKLLWEGSTSTTGPTNIVINQPSFFGGREEGGGWVSQGNFYPGTFSTGSQPQDGYVASRVGAENLPAYLGVSHIVFNKAMIGETPNLRKISFIIERYTNSLGLPNGARVGEDMNPAEAIYQILVDKWSGMGVDPTSIDIPSLVSIGVVLFNEGNGCSVTVGAERGGDTVLSEILRQIDGICYQEPTTGKIKFKLIRNDYNPDLIPVFDEDDIISVRSFTRTGWEDVVSQVKISYQQRGKESQAVAIAQDSAVVAMLGRLRNNSLTFPFVYSPALASVIAARQLSQVSIPLFRFTLEMNRKAYFLKPGDPIKISWPDYGLQELVVRVQKFDAGSLVEGKIVVNVLQDIFAVADVIFAETEETRWTIPETNPVSITQRAFIEMPSFFGQRLEFPISDGKVGYIPMPVKPAFQSSSFSMRSSTTSENLEFLDPENVAYSGYGVLSVQLENTDGFADGFISGPAITLNSSVGAWSPTNTSEQIKNAESGIIFMNGEWMSFDSSTTGLGETILSNVRRGLFGSRPRTHPIGSACYELKDDMVYSGSLDLNEFQTVYYKLLDEAGGKKQDESQVVELSQVAGTLSDRPVRPGFLRIDNLRSGIVIDAQTDAELTFRPRNRLSLEATFENGATEVPDQPETYDVDVFVGGVKNNTLSASGVSSPYTIPFSQTLLIDENCEVRVYSRRTTGNTRTSADYGFIQFEMSQIVITAPAGLISEVII